MATEAQTYITREDYLALERRAENRNEYVDGEIIATSRTSRRHSLIVGNTVVELGTQLKAQSSEVYAFKMRLRTPAADAYLYPDVVVVYAEPKFEDDHFDTLLNPTLIVEVLSKFAESYKRLAKLAYYRTIESLVEYLLVAQEEYRVEQYVRQVDGRWLLSDVRSLESTIEMKSIGCSLTLRDIYNRISID
jgi:Uma2 family endonuclease